jgi:hypothetical protein
LSNSPSQALFPGRSVGGSVKRTSLFKPYKHQLAMLERGVHAGLPGIVTSGTGSGKTESFMLPILATICREAEKWPAPRLDYLQNTWWQEATPAFRPHRVGEHPDRPKAVRAIVLYPMNALVEDQLTRLRRTLDSPQAHEVMNRRLEGNRIFFGRYTSASPIAGHRVHPRINEPPATIAARLRRVASALSTSASDQDKAQRHDSAHPNEDPTRYLFPSVDGAELLARWDMQATPPDLLVTNVSMLGAMLSREVDQPIFDQTRSWLEGHPDAYFFLVLDELHLVRGSTGTEVAGLIRALIHRVGLDQPELRHKLRVLASSTSLPLEDDEGRRSLRYLHDFFGPFGTYEKPGARGAGGPEDWAASIVPGTPALAPFETPLPLDRLPFERLLDILSPTGEFVAEVRRSPPLEQAIVACARALSPRETLPDGPAKFTRAVEIAATALASGVSLRVQKGRVRLPPTSSAGASSGQPTRCLSRRYVALRCFADLAKSCRSSMRHPSKRGPRASENTCSSAALRGCSLPRSSMTGKCSLRASQSTERLCCGATIRMRIARQSG